MKIKYDFSFFIVFAFFSFTSFAWETKEQFDRDFKESVAEFLQTRNQTHILYKNIKDFIEEHMLFLKEYNKFCTYDPSDANMPWSGVMQEIASFSDTGLDALDTFFCVGPRKSFANLPTSTFIRNEEVKSAIEAWASYSDYITYSTAKPGQSGVFSVYDPAALNTLLNTEENLRVLNKNALKPEDLIELLLNDDPRFDLRSGNVDMFQLIARVFGREISREKIEELMSYNF